jgi:hypothetical protein
VTCFRGLIPWKAVASLRKADGSPLDNNPVDSFSMDRHRTERSGATTYWVRGGDLLNVWIARYEPDSAAFEQEEGDWFPVSREDILREVREALRHLRVGAPSPGAALESRGCAPVRKRLPDSVTTTVPKLSRTWEIFASATSSSLQQACRDWTCC